MLSQRVRTLEPSATLVVNSLRLELQAEGRRVFNFGAGEPDFPTPDFIVEAGVRALRGGWTRYTAVAGVPELRGAIAENLQHTHGVRVGADEVIVTSGAKQALWEFLQTLLDPGDEVLLPAPYWVSYPDMIRLADGIPTIVPCTRETHYRATPELLGRYVTPRTVGLILNSPNNPTGVVYDAAQCAALVAFAEAHDLWILSDEIYDRFVFDGVFASPLSERTRARVTVVNGVSKSYSMTGWRIGWAIGPRAIIEGMGRVQGHCSSNPAAVSQAAALAAVTARDDPFVPAALASYRTRRARVLELLAGVPGISVAPPGGAFYVFLDLDERLAPGETSTGFCRALLEHAGVALVPGEAFGAPRGARLSYACSLEEIDEGLAALRSYLVS